MTIGPSACASRIIWDEAALGSPASAAPAAKMKRIAAIAAAEETLRYMTSLCGPAGMPAGSGACLHNLLKPLPKRGGPLSGAIIKTDDDLWKIIA
jgi:hypothetical protein